MQSAEVLDCLVVGAGQSGLMMGHLLKQAGFNYCVVDKAKQCGGAWQYRPPSLHLFTPRRFSALSPMSMPGDPDGYPNSLEMSQYLMAYAQNAELNVNLECLVEEVSQTDDGFFKVKLQQQGKQNKEIWLYAKSIVNAAGNNQILNVPKWAIQIPSRVMQLRAEDWEQALNLPKSATVLVVGDGAWGRLVAFELARHTQVILACGKKRKLSPKRILGRSIFCWLDWLGVLRADKNSWVGRFLRLREPIPMAHANNRALRNREVSVCGRALGIESSGEIVFSCGNNQHVDAVVWCAGYHEDNAWLKLPINCEQALLEGQGRCNEVPGLFVLGRKWMTCKASELIMGVEHDARLVLSYVHAHLQTMPIQPIDPIQPIGPTSPVLEKTKGYNHA